MRRLFKRKIYTGTLFLLLIGASFQVEAESLDWKETFDQESEISNWLVAYGGWNITDGVLETTSCENVNNDDCFTSIWHNQSKVTGTWSFDIFQPGNESFGTLFYFMGWGQASTVYVNLHPGNGYVIHVYGNGDIDLDYVAGCCYQYSPGSYKTTDNTTGWKHIEVTRNSTGYMEVRLNSINIINATHNLIPKSENVNIQTLTTGTKFDNISYKEGITIGGTEQKSANTPGFDLVPALVFLPIISIIIMRKRNKLGKN